MNIKKASILVICMFLLTSSMIQINALSLNEIKNQNKDIETWQKTYSGSPEFIKQVDNGYIVTGSKRVDKTSDYSDLLIYKIDEQGNEMWRTTYDIRYAERLNYGAQDIDGGYIFTGVTTSKGSRGDVLIVKLDENGNLEWNSTFGDNKSESGFAIFTVEDSGYLVFAQTRTLDDLGDIWILKISRTGTIQWEQTITNSPPAKCKEVKKTNGGKYIITGVKDSKPWLIKIDTQGTIIWEKTYNINGYSKSVVQTSDGRYAIAGGIRNQNKPADPFLLITDENGNLLSEVEYEKNKDGVEILSSIDCIDKTSDGGFIIFTQCETGYVGAYDWLLIKTDSEGNEIWRRPFEALINLGCSNDYSYQCQSTSDNGIIMLGITNDYDYKEIIWIVKTDCNGHLSHKPNTPTITGPSEGKTNEIYEFTFDAGDPDSDQIFYRVHFGFSNYTNDEWVGPFDSDEEITISNDWARKGTYTIKLTLYDDTLEYSETATKEITIKQGKSKDIQFSSFLEKILQNFPLLYNLINLK